MRRRRPASFSNAAVIVISVALLVRPAGVRAQSTDEKQACVAASEDAQKLRDDHKLTKAREQLVFCARDACPQVVRKDCGHWLSEVESSLPSIVLAACAGADDLTAVKVTLDGAPFADQLDGRAVFVDPGPHVFRFETAGKPPVDRQVVVREGERNREVSVDFGASTTKVAPASSDPHSPAAPEGPHPADSPHPSLAPAFIASGVAVVGLSSFVFFGLSGKNDVNSMRDTCGPTHSCSQTDVDTAKQKLLIADISLGVGLVAAGVATYFFLTSSSHDRAKGSTAGPHLAKAPLLLSAGAAPLPEGGAEAALSGRF